MEEVFRIIKEEFRLATALSGLWPYLYLHLCIVVCIYVCVCYVCVCYVYICVCVCVCRVYIRMCVFVCACMHVHGTGFRVTHYNLHMNTHQGHAYSYW